MKRVPGKVINTGCVKSHQKNSYMNPHHILINDLDAEVGSTITKFSGVTKLGGDVHCLEGQGALQRNVDWRKNWTIFISMKCNELLPD